MNIVPERQRLFDGLAVSASTLCLIHCLLPPVLFLLVPTLGAILTIPEGFHRAALAFAIPTSAIAIGYRRHHRAIPSLVVLPGIGVLTLGLLTPEGWMEVMLTVAGSTLFVVGHVLNWRAFSEPGTTGR